MIMTILKISDSNRDRQDLYIVKPAEFSSHTFVTSFVTVHNENQK